MFKGSCVALVTPMTAQGEIDETALRTLIEWHIQEGTQAIVVNGSTGESATLTEQEQQRNIEITCETVKKRIPVIAGTGTNATASTISRTQAAKEMGADACLVVTPYYNRPTQEGLIQHYILAAKVGLPIIPYNVPTRTGCDIQPETIGKLSEISNIIGIKMPGEPQRLQAAREYCRSDFMFYSGDDGLNLKFIQAGGNGAVSVAANIIPRLMQDLCHYALEKEDIKAQNIDDKLKVFYKFLSIETNPIPVKWAMHTLGKIDKGIRLPLTPLSLQHYKLLKDVLDTSQIQ